LTETDGTTVGTNMKTFVNILGYRFNAIHIVYYRVRNGCYIDIFLKNVGGVIEPLSFTYPLTQEGTAKMASDIQMLDDLLLKKE
jgi:hypothetical protein